MFIGASRRSLLFFFFLKCKHTERKQITTARARARVAHVRPGRAQIVFPHDERHVCVYAVYFTEPLVK